MKKFFSFIAVAMVLVACNKSDSPGNGSSDIAFDLLGSLNVADAKMLYLKDSATTRSGDGGVYWKVDLDGNISKLIVTGSDGTPNEIDIVVITKLSDNVIYIEPSQTQMYELLQKYTGSLDCYMTSAELGMLVDLRTEKMYRTPCRRANAIGYNILNSEFWLYANQGSYYVDKSGNIYIGAYIGAYINGYGFIYNGTAIYKINPSDYTYQHILPAGISYQEFSVTSNGYVIYKESGIVKCLCPSGGIVPIGFYNNEDTGHASYFTIGNDIYSYSSHPASLLKWSETEDGSLIHSEIDAVYDDHELNISAGYTNNLKESSAIIYADYYELDYTFGFYEFNGESFAKLDIDGNDGGYLSETSDSWLSRHSDRSTIFKISKNDYTVTEIFIENSISLDFDATSASSPIIQFYGSYGDGTERCGFIDADNNIVYNDESMNLSSSEYESAVLLF